MSSLCSKGILYLTRLLHSYREYNRLMKLSICNVCLIYILQNKYLRQFRQLFILHVNLKPRNSTSLPL
jgi:hypothetical protein